MIRNKVFEGKIFTEGRALKKINTNVDFEPVS